MEGSQAKPTSSRCLLVNSNGPLQTNLLMMYTQNNLRTSPGRGISGHAPGTRPGNGAMRASDGWLNFKTRRLIEINSKKLRVLTSKERTDASDGLANYPSRIEGVARRLNGKFDGKFYRN